MAATLGVLGVIRGRSGEAREGTVADRPKQWFAFHDLRKTFSTHVLRATGDLTAVQRFLGYSSASVTKAVYIGEDMDLLTESVEKLDFILPPAPAGEHTVSTRRVRLVPGFRAAHK